MGMCKLFGCVGSTKQPVLAVLADIPLSSLPSRSTEYTACRLFQKCNVMHIIDCCCTDLQTYSDIHTYIHMWKCCVLCSTSTILLYTADSVDYPSLKLRLHKI